MSHGPLYINIERVYIRVMRVGAMFRGLTRRLLNRYGRLINTFIECSDCP